jgi:hypothetical protein
VKRRRYRPLANKVTPWAAQGYSRHYDALFFGEHALRGSRIFLYCGWACSLLEVSNFTFAEWPWRRYHNYPLGTGFICPGCRRVMKMQVSDTTVPGTGGR